MAARSWALRLTAFAVSPGERTGFGLDLGLAQPCDAARAVSEESRSVCAT